VTFALPTGPGHGRHRVSVWSVDGALLSPASAREPVDVEFPAGTTFFVQASVPTLTSGTGGAAREEVRWPLRASADGTAVLEIGTTPKYGPSSALAIHVAGAEQDGAPQVLG
jgi:hypothetical protein